MIGSYKLVSAVLGIVVVIGSQQARISLPTINKCYVDNDQGYGGKNRTMLSDGRAEFPLSSYGPSLDRRFERKMIQLPLFATNRVFIVKHTTLHVSAK
jgi:hypothetical protein